MAFVQRLNVVLEVPDNDEERYYNMGYNIIDEKGNLIKRAIPTDINELRYEFVQHTKKIAELEKEIASLKSKKTTKKAVETQE